jgi:glycine/sarcosine N-methyltransferase
MDTHTQSAYDQLSASYDYFVNWNNRLSFELPFLTQQLAGGEKASRILDAACGTGMHAIALAKQGYAASGADISQGMIEKARENALRDQVPVRFKQGGFGELKEKFGENLFEGLLCLGNSLPHVASLEHLQQTLRDFSAVLVPQGKLILQNRNFDGVLAAQARWMEPQSHREGSREWIFIRFYDFLPDGKIAFNILTLLREGEAAWQQQQTTTTLLPLTQKQLTEGLIQAGFERIAFFGGLNGSAYQADTSPNLVITAVKKSPL